MIFRATILIDFVKSNHFNFDQLKQEKKREREKSRPLTQNYKKSRRKWHTKDGVMTQKPQQQQKH